MHPGRRLVDNKDMEVECTDSALDVNPKHVRREIINEPFLYYTNIKGSLGIDVLAGESFITLTPQTIGNFSQNDLIRIHENSKWEVGAVKIMSISGQTVYVDRPLDNSYTKKSIYRKSIR